MTWGVSLVTEQKTDRHGWEEKLSEEEGAGIHTGLSPYISCSGPSIPPEGRVNPERHLACLQGKTRCLHHQGSVYLTACCVKVYENAQSEHTAQGTAEAWQSADAA